MLFAYSKNPPLIQINSTLKSFQKKNFLNIMELLKNIKGKLRKMIFF